MMPKKKRIETPEEQAERFNQAVRDMVDAGELSSTEADARFERALDGVAKLRHEWFLGEPGQEAPTSEPD